MPTRSFIIASLLTPALVWAGDEPAGEGKALFEDNCSACHTLALPQSQQLDRNGWEWVVDDMVNEMGLNWLNENELTLIIDHLVEHYGPEQ